jgi:hypothetical protein
MQDYIVEIKQIGTNNFVYSDCNSITFLNQGTNDIFIDQTIQLSFGQSFVIDGNDNEVCRHRFFINFINSGGTNACAIIRKIYIQ